MSASSARLALLVSHRFPEDSIGGTEVLTRDVALGLRERGFNVIWLAVSPAGAKGPVCRHSPEGVEQWCLPTVFPQGYPVGWQTAEAAQAVNVSACLALFLGERRLDIVHLHHFARVGLSFLALPAFENAARFATLTDYTAVCADFQLQRRASGVACTGNVAARDCLECIGGDDGNANHAEDVAAWRLRNLQVLSNFDGLFVQTPYQRQLLERLGFPGNRMVSDRAAYRVPSAEGRPMRKAGHPFRFAYIGRASPEKGLAVAVRAFALLRETHGDNVASLLMITPDPVAAQQLVGESATQPKLMWSGPVDHGDLGTVLKDIDCLLVPSLWLENHPSILSYALTYGVAVLCSDVLSMQHLKGTANLHFAPAGDVPAWAAAMKTRIDWPEADCHVAEGAGLRSFDDYLSHIELAYKGVAA
jgi:glycosyltransferase involved in cell wall biosynthesis